MPRRNSQGKELLERLGRREAPAWDSLAGREEGRLEELAEGYKQFLSRAKTEREAAAELVEEARRHGFVPLEELKGRPKPGSGFFQVNREKAVIMGVWGEEPPSVGAHLIGAHLDAPRLDLKPQPLYEGEGLALFKTHYYGGIKKYQWTAVPLALHGVVVRADGSVLRLNLGEEPGDPVFTITDLLPHLGKDQLKKNLGEAVGGEDLNVVAGSKPYPDREAKDRFKLALLELLHRQYGLVEEDFVSAELELVPAGPARDLGLDRSMVAAYGQDDRVCAYLAARALLEVKKPPRLALVVLVDKEEIGSVGSTSIQSRFLERVAGRCLALAGEEGSLALDRLLERSRALSADVNAALDPTYPDVMDKRNAARLGRGLVVTKYTGSGGKYHTNDAPAELVGWLRRLFNEQGVTWQTGELGKVDQGGGGTIAMFLANYGMDVVDCGVPVLSMHSPLEVVSKADLWMAWRGFSAFLSAR